MSTLRSDSEAETVLTITPGAGDEQNDTFSQVKYPVERTAPSCCCSETHYRRLARCSIICGCSCIGIKALEYSFKAERTTNPEYAAKLSKKSRYYSIISFVTFIGILLSVPILTLLISYLITLKN